MVFVQAVHYTIELLLLKVILTRLGFSEIAKVKYGLFLLKFILTRSGVMEIV